MRMANYLPSLIKAFANIGDNDAFVFIAGAEWSFLNDAEARQMLSKN